MMPPAADYALAIMPDLGFSWMDPDEFVRVSFPSALLSRWLGVQVAVAMTRTSTWAGITSRVSRSLTVRMA